MERLTRREFIIGGLGVAGGLALKAGEALGATPKVDKEQTKRLDHLEAQSGVAYRLGVDNTMIIASAQNQAIGYEPLVVFLDSAIKKVEETGIDPLQIGFWSTVNESPEISPLPTPK